ncbi:trans-4-hydroxy-L-proline dehydratase [Williamwhitmania taraxaci]|uniref:Formate C-acetyltransferase n=1 Tax=Williamwhitmania taraxaci TaxID=1640674 RepID=A0A1G6N649_9BACT|nr:trans-4-hydroxy-L-proline dehydratase [Williamwhitmania taraxaci]SDC63300.1 formate C-acetyltransferase [Williamwhitmania taraxaci]
MINERIRTQREMSLRAINHISAERAILVTEFYALPSTALLSVPLQRAGALMYILSRKAICVNPFELIVGERGPAPKATSTYPEVCLHSIADLEILDSRPKVSYKVDEEVRKVYAEVIIPFWQGHTIRDRVFEQTTDEWQRCYAAGVFTEFQEQRAPGHTVAGKKLFQKGILDLKNDIQKSLASLDPLTDNHVFDKREELKAMDMAADAILVFAERHAQELERLAAIETDSVRKDEFIEMARICRKVPANAPETFHEMLQHYWFIHVGVITELNPWDSFNPGRLDQHLYPFYQKELADGSLTKAKAEELLQSFWVKFNNHPSPPKMGITAKESNTYTDFALINLGGLTSEGFDAVNGLSYLILDVIEEMRILQPSSMVQLSKKNPDSFITRAIKITKTGFGQPSIFNTDAIIQELVRQGKSLEDARNGGASGCVESGAFGTEAYWLTGYFNLPKVLEITMHNGIDPRTGARIGLETGIVTEFQTFNDLWMAFEKQLQHFIDIKIKGNCIIEQLYGRTLPAPFLSLFIDDCIANGKDYNAGGARYNSSYIQGVGLGSITDSLASLRYHVFDNKTITMDEMMRVLDANFEGSDAFRAKTIYETPKFGNDEDYADGHAVEVFNLLWSMLDGRPTARGGQFRLDMLPTTCHVYFGSLIGATPDGRLATMPLSEGISPVQGADRKGPTAVIKSVSKFDHLKTGGTLLNQKFTPEFFDGEDAIGKIVKLVRTYFRMDGHHIQFNVVSAVTLRDAQKHPENYGDLIVRVAGYSDYYNDLTPELQAEIIRRTEHQLYS